MQRICFRLQIDPDLLDRYRQLHRDVWPEMREALSKAGWHNYSLFLEPDGTLIGYLECEDFDLAKKMMEATDVNKRWQASMSQFFKDLGAMAPDQAMKPIEEIFHLP